MNIETKHIETKCLRCGFVMVRPVWCLRLNPRCTGLNPDVKRTGVGRVSCNGMLVVNFDPRVKS